MRTTGTIEVEKPNNLLDKPLIEKMDLDLGTEVHGASVQNVEEQVAENDVSNTPPASKRRKLEPQQPKGLGYCFLNR